MAPPEKITVSSDLRASRIRTNGHELGRMVTNWDEWSRIGTNGQGLGSCWYATSPWVTQQRAPRRLASAAGTPHQGSSSRHETTGGVGGDSAARVGRSLAEIPRETAAERQRSQSRQKNRLPKSPDEQRSLPSRSHSGLPQIRLPPHQSHL